MPALIDLRKRIKSVRNTQQITQAMKTVSAAKLKKAQRAVLEDRPYSFSFSNLLDHVILWKEDFFHPLLEEREEKRVMGIVITSDKGLCGAFNSNLLEKSHSFFKEKATSSEVNLILIGKKAFNFFKKLTFPIEQSYTDNIDKLTFHDIQEISRFLIDKYVFQEIDAVYVAYNEFKSILAPRIIIDKLLPLVPLKVDDSHRILVADWAPEAFSILRLLLPHYFEIRVYHYFLEFLAAEHAARMLAMDNASKNAEDLIQDLTLILNKIRQASITKELLEIMTTVDALSKK